MKNGKIYDGKSAQIIEDSFKSAYPLMLAKNGINDSNTIATGGMYLEQQLREILPEVLSEVYPEMPLLNFMSVDNSGALSQSIIQRAQSFEGRHESTHETANTKGTLTVNRTAREQLVVEYAAETNYSETDLQRGILLNENIDTALIEAHNISYMTWIDEIGFEGIKNKDDNNTLLTEGLTNYSDTIASLVKTAGATFAASDGLTIYGEIQNLYNEMIGEAGAAAVLRPNVVVLPPKQFSIISTELMTGTSPVTGFVTVKDFIESQLGLTCYASTRCSGKGAGSTDRLVMINNDRRNMRFHLPEPLRFAPIDIRGFKYNLQSKFRIAGMGFNRNNAIGYLDAI